MKSKVVIANVVNIRNEFYIAFGENVTHLIDQAVGEHFREFFQFLEEDQTPAETYVPLVPSFATQHKFNGIEWVMVTELFSTDQGDFYWQTTVGTKETFDRHGNDQEWGEVHPTPQ